MRSACIVLIVFCISPVMNASAQQTGTIKGIVKEERGSELLTGANVYLRSTKSGSAAGVDGRYEIKKVNPGTYTVVCSFIGYSTVEKIVELTSGQTIILDFYLSQETIQGDEIVVSREMLLGGTGKISGIPGSAHYIGAKELGKFNYDDIHRILQAVPGINIQEEDGYGLRPNIGMRGTGVARSQKISLMEDGVLIAPAPYSAPAAYYFPTVGRMKAIEIRKGSSQIKYGPYTTGGALNLISTMIPFKFEGRVNISAGDYNEKQIHAYVGDSHKNFGFLVETYQTAADGFKKLDGGGNTGFDKNDYMVKLRFNSDTRASLYQALTVKLTQTDEQSNETYLGLTDDDYRIDPFRRYAASQNDLMTARHKQLSVNHFLKFGERYDISSTYYQNTFSRNWYKLEKIVSRESGKVSRLVDILSNPDEYAEEYAVLTGSVNTDDKYPILQANNRNYYSTGIQSVMGLEFGSKEATNHQIELGIRYHKDRVDRYQWVDSYKMDKGVMKLLDAGVPGTESNRIGSAKSLALFAQYRLSVGNLQIVPGLRFEAITLERKDYGSSDPERSENNLNKRKNSINVWIPGAGVNYAFTSSLKAFAGLHKGFSPPGSKENTQPETSINYELGTQFNVKELDAQAIFFYNDYSNLLGTDLAGSGGSGSGDLFNGGEVATHGLEFVLKYDPGQISGISGIRLPMSIVYTYTNAKFKSSFNSDYAPWGRVERGDRLPYLPVHQFALNISLELEKLNLYLSSKYVGAMRTTAGQGQIEFSNSTGSHFIIDGSIEYTLTDRSNLFMSVRNIANATYIAARRPAGIRPGLPRIVKLGIKTSW